MERQQIIEKVLESKIIVIMRGMIEEQLIATVDAMYKGGIRLVEVTFDQSGKIPDEITAKNIRTLTDTFEGRVLVGAGTVMTTAQVELAHKSGAKYIISPDSCREVIERTVELGMVSMPGVFTPTEAANAHRWGADFVKLFPNSEVNISYLECLTVPLSHIRFLAVGGVNADNIADYLGAGAVGVGVATSIVNKKLIAEEKYEEITKLAFAHTKAAGIEL